MSNLNSAQEKNSQNRKYSDNIKTKSKPYDQSRIERGADI